MPAAREGGTHDVPAAREGGMHDVPDAGLESGSEFFRCSCSKKVTSPSVHVTLVGEEGNQEVLR